jgi:hypothetical protein
MTLSIPVFNFYPVTAVMIVLLALLVWGYALAWFLVNDQVKLAVYRIFDLRH